MTSNTTTNKEFVRPMISKRSSSPMIFNTKQKPNSLLSSCCSCSHKRQKSQQLNTNIQLDNGITTIEDTKYDVHKGFFKRIQCFKGLNKIIFDIFFKSKKQLKDFYS